MSGVLRTVGKVAGVVASVAMFIPGGQAVGAIAAAVSAAANIGAELTAKKPPAQGSVTQTTIGTDQPSCEILGRTYSPGARVHLVGYGPEIKKVKNPYLLAVDVVGVGGPYQALESVLADMRPVSFSGEAAGGYFNGFLWRSFQLGQQTEASALALHYPGAPGWGADAKLSGKPAIAWNALFDKDGKVFASGFAPMGSVWQGVKAYDPRKDSTYPGGFGAHRWANPANTAAFDAARATWEYTTNPGLLALRNALGTWERDEATPGSRYQKVFGVGMAIDGLIVGDFVTLSNVCDANNWQCGGRIFEPGDRWANLKRILASGGAEVAWRGGLLGLKVQAPRVALDTITEDDLADGEIVIRAMQGWEQRLNTLVPKYRSEAHKWEYVATTEPVTIASYVAQDGEEKREERQLDLVQDPRQASQLCAYELFDRRELGEIELPCGPRLRRYGAGDLLKINLPEVGLPMQEAVVLKRSLNPVTMGVTLTMRGETPGKHALALALNGTAPPTPALRTTEDIDQTAVQIGANAALRIMSSTIEYPVTSNANSISVAAFNATLSDGRANVAFAAGSVTGLAESTSYVVLFDQSAGQYIAPVAPALDEMADPDNVLVARIATLNPAGEPPPQETPPPGYYPRNPIP